MFSNQTQSALHPKITHACFDAAYRVLNDAAAAHAFPGCAFGVLAHDEVVLQDACGQFTYESDSAAVAPETIFDVASITKVVATTATAMLLHQRGKLDLDMPLGNLLPEFVAGRPRDDYAHHITISHLLAHNSGLPSYVEFFHTITETGKLLRTCYRLPIEAAPGTRAEYSDPGYILLGKALETILGEALPSWTEREIFAPLAMTSTGFLPPKELRPLIPPTEMDTWFRHRRIQGEVQDENASVLGGAAGHAGLFTNVPDLLRFAVEILHSIDGSDSAHLFRQKTVEFFAKRQPPEGSSRALGWDTPSEKGSSGHHFSRRSIGHLGYSGCSLWIDLDAAIAVVLLTNRTWPDRKCQLIRQVRPAFHDAVRDALKKVGTSTPHAARRL